MRFSPVNILPQILFNAATFLMHPFRFAGWWGHHPFHCRCFRPADLYHLEFLNFEELTMVAHTSSFWVASWLHLNWYGLVGQRPVLKMNWFAGTANQPPVPRRAGGSSSGGILSQSWSNIVISIENIFNTAFWLGQRLVTAKSPLHCCWDTSGVCLRETV